MAPVKPPTKAPVKPPTTAPIKPPTKAPVKPPTKAPFKPPTKAPVKPPTYAPVQKCDYECPANSFHKLLRLCYNSFDDCDCNYGYYKSTTDDVCIKYVVPTKSPVKPPTYAPVKPPTKAPVKPPTTAPVKPPTKAPVKPPTYAPVNPPTNTPLQPPTKAPVKAPVKQCDFQCPTNSHSSNSNCCNSFDDCECNNGYHKAVFANICIDISLDVNIGH